MLHCLSTVPWDSQTYFWSVLDTEDKRNFRLASKACARIAHEHLGAVSLTLTTDTVGYIRAVPHWTRLVRRLRSLSTWRLCATHGMTQALQASRLCMLMASVGRQPFTSLTCMHLAAGVIVSPEADMAGCFPNLRSLVVSDLLQEDQQTVLSALEGLVGPRLELLRIDGGDIYDCVPLLHTPLDVEVPVHLQVPPAVPMRPLTSLLRRTPGLRALTISFDQVNPPRACGACMQGSSGGS